MNIESGKCILVNLFLCALNGLLARRAEKEIFYTVKTWKIDLPEADKHSAACISMFLNKQLHAA